MTDDNRFEQWYVENAFDYVANPIGSRDCGLMRKAWHAAIAELRTRDPAKDDDPVELWAEIHRLRAALKGPNGFDTWQDAAVAERVRRVKAETARDPAVLVEALERIANNDPNMLAPFLVAREALAEWRAKQ